MADAIRKSVSSKKNSDLDHVEEQRSTSEGHGAHEAIARDGTDAGVAESSISSEMADAIRGSVSSKKNSDFDHVEEQRTCEGHGADEAITRDGTGAGVADSKSATVKSTDPRARCHLHTLARENSEVRDILSNLKVSAATKKSLVVLLIGKTGMGKSSIFNAIFGKREKPKFTQSATGDSIDLGDDGYDGVTVRVIDTPGLDKVSGAEGEKYYQEVKPHVQDADLILFCYQITQRVHYEDLKVMKFLKKKFGDRILAKMIMILSFANCIIAPDDDKDSLEEIKKNEITTTTNALKEKMKEAKFDHGIVDEVQFICAENPYKADDWLLNFLASCFTLGISENTKAALLQTTYKLWEERAVFDGTSKTLMLSTGIVLITIGVLALPIPPIGAAAIIGGGIAIAVHSHRNKEECRRNKEYRKRINVMTKKD